MGEYYLFFNIITFLDLALPYRSACRQENVASGLFETRFSPIYVVNYLNHMSLILCTADPLGIHPQANIAVLTLGVIQLLYLKG